MASLYTIHALPPDSKCIRVLTVHAITGGSSINPTVADDPPIESNLSIIDLDNTQVKFAALSYVWGTFASPADSITCDNVSIKVTSNCLAALKNLRRKLGSFTIWVDAICINQDNVAEKEQQIPLMGSIYSSAETVYAWLGDATEKTHRAMRYMAKDILSGFLTMNEDGTIKRRHWAAVWSVVSARWSKTRHPIPFEDYTLSPTGRPPRYLGRHTLQQLWNEKMGPKAHYQGDYVRIGDLRELFAKEWICRLWTYQEIVLATNPILVCGLSHVPWDAFEKMLLFLDMNFLFAPQELIRVWVSILVSREKLGIGPPEDPKSKRIPFEEYRKFMRDAAGLAHNVRITLTTIGVSVIAGALYAGFVLEFFFEVTGHHHNVGMIVVGSLILVLLSFAPLTQKSISRKMRQSMLPYPHEDFATGLSWRKAKDPKDMAFGTWAMLARAGATTLPKPDYALEIGDVYRQLALHLLKTTSSLNVVGLATQRNCSGQPSWVPDWSRAYQQRSGIKGGNVQGTGQRTKSWITSGEAQMRALLGTRPCLELDPTGTILTVQASPVGHISSLFLFRSSSTAFREEETHPHIHNLRLALMYANYFLGDQIGLVNLQVNRPSFPYNMLELLDIDPETIYEEENLPALKAWTRFMKKNRRKGVPKLSAILQADDDLLASHMTVCNLLVMHKRTTVRVDLSNSPFKRGLGACPRAVQVGDQVVRVEGLPGLLVVRPCGDSETDVKIVSSINLAMMMDKWWEVYVRRKAFNPHFVEYRIH